MIYRRRASPLHAARASVGCVYCLALGCAALILSSPAALGALILAVLTAGTLAGVGRELRRAALWAVPLALTIALVNALVSRGGLTVIVRLGQLPLLGHTDITLESTVYGGVLGLRAVSLILAASLYAAAVDPDEILRGLRRVGFRSALSATIATRMIPILARDAGRLAEASRCRPGPPPSRLALMRVATSGLLERAFDMAATLEVRGYGIARRPPRRRSPWSRHDLAFAAAALAVLGLAVAIRGVAPLHAYPMLRAPVSGLAVGLVALLVAAALVPFLGRRGVQP